MDGGNGRGAWHAEVARRGPWVGRGGPGQCLQAVLRLPGAGLPRERRLHGPGELGDGPRGGGPVRLRAALGLPDVERDGRGLADPLGEAGGGDRARPGPGLPGRIFAAGQLRPLGPRGGRDRRLRPGRGGGHGDRPEAPLRPTGALGLPGHGVRHVPAALAPAVRDEADGGGDPGPGGHHRRLLPGPDPPGPARPLGRDPGPSAEPPAGGPVRRHRHPGRDGDAAQPVSPLGPGAVEADRR